MEDESILDLSCRDLARLPASLDACVLELNLAFNELTSLNGIIEDCPRLQRLGAGHNLIAALPTGLNVLRDLCRIDLSHNRLRTVEPLPSCPALAELWLSHNLLELAAIPPLRAAAALRSLVLVRNPCDDAKPAGICRHATVLSLPQLSSLDAEPIDAAARSDALAFLRQEQPRCALAELLGPKQALTLLRRSPSVTQPPPPPPPRHAAPRPRPLRDGEPHDALALDACRDVAPGGGLGVESIPEAPSPRSPHGGGGGGACGGRAYGGGTCGGVTCGGGAWHSASSSCEVDGASAADASLARAQWKLDQSERALCEARAATSCAPPRHPPRCGRRAAAQARGGDGRPHSPHSPPHLSQLAKTSTPPSTPHADLRSTLTPPFPPRPSSHLPQPVGRCSVSQPQCRRSTKTSQSPTLRRDQRRDQRRGQRRDQRRDQRPCSSDPTGLASRGGPADPWRLQWIPRRGRAAMRCALTSGGGGNPGIRTPLKERIWDSNAS